MQDILKSGLEARNGEAHYLSENLIKATLMINKTCGKCNKIS